MKATCYHIAFIVEKKIVKRIFHVTVTQVILDDREMFTFVSTWATEAAGC